MRDLNKSQWAWWFGIVKLRATHLASIIAGCASPHDSHPPNLKMYKPSIGRGEQNIQNSENSSRASLLPGSLSGALQKRSPDLVQVLLTIFSNLSSKRLSSARCNLQANCFLMWWLWRRWGHTGRYLFDLCLLVFVWLSFLQASKTLRSWLCLTSQCQPDMFRREILLSLSIFLSSNASLQLFWFLLPLAEFHWSFFLVVSRESSQGLSWSLFWGSIRLVSGSDQPPWTSIDAPHV